MTTKARLYYEAHITVEEPSLITFEEFATFARARNFRASRFSEDEVDDYSGKWFLSYRGEDLEDTKRAVGAARADLDPLGYEVLRWKIEDTLLDSKYGDTL